MSEDFDAPLELIDFPITPMGAESTPLRRLFHEVSGDLRPDSLDIPSIEKRARLAVLRGDATRDGVRALGRDILLLIDALAERPL